jgi:protocatechuate 3,4-dioxygenase beta subunit
VHDQLTRRHVIGAAGAAGVALLIGGVRPGPGGLFDAGPDEAVAATCVMTPAKTVGPYFVDEELNRSDVREGQAGAPLTLTMYVFDADNDCAPVKGAQVDIWHCNASGLYSDEAANGTSGAKWLRGYQLTDAGGKVEFETIYPGWYSGRTVHIHFKVRVYDGSAETLEFTSQMFFTDAMNSAVFASAPYNTRGAPDTTDASDSIYGSDGGMLLLHPTADGSGGYGAEFSVGVSKATSQIGNDSAGGGAPGGPPAPADTAVNAALKSLKVVRAATGARRLRLSITAGEQVKAGVRLSRNGKTLARTAARTLSTGAHSLRVSVPARVSAGPATVRVTFTDSAGNSRTATRTVHLPARRG